jgi:PTS hybrid protein
VGFVLVSLRAGLGVGAAVLARPASGGQVRVEPAGGTDDGRLGSSIAKVRAAVAAADAGAGVLLLPDLGSSVLVIRVLLADGEDLPDPIAIADAPFVEGAVAATVTAAVGGDIKAVHAAAEEARNARKL